MLDYNITPYQIKDTGGSKVVNFRPYFLTIKVLFNKKREMIGMGMCG